MKRVYLAEKKQQGETIAQFLDSSIKVNRHDNVTHYVLSNGDVVCWCQGHLYGLAMPEHYSPELRQWTLETLPFRPEQWDLEITAAGKKLMPVITRELDKADEVVLCSDFDREGQYLGLNAIREAGYSGRILRAPVTALGKIELQRAFERVEDISKTMPLYYSALARSHADYLVGINLTRFFSCLGKQASYKEKVNIGRVITPTINLIVERELEIANFKSKSFYILNVLLSVQKGQFKAKWNIPKAYLDHDGYLTNYNVAKSTMVKLQGKPFTIINVEKKTVTQQPPLPFSLSDLQVYCGDHFNLSPDRTLAIVQKLYDEQYTTYPRTDCSYLPESQHSDAPIIIAQLCKDPEFMQLAQGCDTSIKSQAFSDKKMGNSSHNAIVPTMEYKSPSMLSPDEFKVYDAIRRRYIAQFYVPAEFDAVQVTAESQGEFFSAGGRTLKRAGYRIIFSDDLLEDNNDSTDEEETEKIPPLAIGEMAVAQNFNLESKKTRAPKRYVQHTLAKAMRHIDTLVEDPQQKAI
ncbi:MAG: DNA topoisomerase, partial [Succinivibrio sp.]